MIRVLLADDQRLVRAGFRMILRAEPDLEVVGEAADGVEAVEGARRLRPDVVLLDIGLPGMDGYDVATALRRDEACKNTVIIAVSGYGQEEDRRRSHEAGFDFHLVKPIDQDALLKLLSTS